MLTVPIATGGAANAPLKTAVDGEAVLILMIEVDMAMGAAMP